MRFHSLDGLRGYMLLAILAVHLKGATNAYFLANFNHHMFSHADAALGFVFLSGLVAAIFYTRRFETAGFANMRTQMHRRSATIYIYHLLLLVICAILLFLMHHQTLNDAFRWGTSIPITMVLASLLVLQPMYLDILPMYILFMFIAPWALRAIVAGRVWRVIAISIALWVISLVDLSDLFLNFATKLSGLENYDLKLHQTFDFLGWQVIFMSGLIIGGLYQSKQLKLEWFKGKIARQFFYTSVFCSLLFMIHLLLTRFGYQLPMVGEKFAQWSAQQTILFEKSHPSLLLVANFASICYMIFWMLLNGLTDQNSLIRGSSKLLNGLLCHPALTLLGRNSLSVFAWQIVVTFLFFFFWADTVKMLHPVLREGITALALLSLYIPALLNTKFKDIRRSRLATA